MPILSQHVPTLVIGRLGAAGFQSDPQNQFCNHFTTNLRNLIVAICRHFEEDIAREVARPECERSVEELNSWAIQVIRDILFGSLGVFRQRILDHANLDEKATIQCDQALTYFAWLIDHTEEMKEATTLARRIKPSSPKFERKRTEQSRNWTPYGVDIAWDAIRRFFRGAA